MSNQLTLRDHFAGLAMSGLAGNDGYTGLEYIAIDAYALADAMIRERNKHHTERHEELSNVSDSGEV